jgi:methionine-rich copper-binding protein CopC
MVLRRMIAAFALATLGVTALATPAFAHAELKGSNPAKGASVAAAPKQIELTFSEAVSPQTITVTGPQGTQWTVGQVSVAGPVVTAPVTAVGPAGEYTIAYTVLSDDGDPVNGTIAFTLTAPATTAAATTTTTTPTTAATATSANSSAAQAPASNDDGGLPVWVWILIVVVIIVAGGLVARRVLNRTDKNESPAER